MTFKKAHFVLLTILLPLATWAAPAINFCQNPVSFVCSGQNQNEYQNSRSELYKNALQKVVKTYPLLSIDQDRLNYTKLAADQTDAAQAFFSAELLKTFESYLKKENLVLTNADLLPMKSEVGRFAAKYYKDTNALDLITGINVISTQSQYAQFVETLPAEIKSIESVSTFYDRFCGDLQPQAHFEKSQNFVLVCPGLILKALASGSNKSIKAMNKQELIRRLTFVLSHEMSHTLDMNITMGTFYSCLQKNYPHQQGEFEFGKRPEVYADFFAYNQLSNELKKLKTTEEKIELTRANLQGLCESNTSVDHPTKEFRIGVLLNYPSVSSQLGCAPKAFKNQCQ